MNKTIDLVIPLRLEPKTSDMDLGRRNIEKWNRKRDGALGEMVPVAEHKHVYGESNGSTPKFVATRKGVKARFWFHFDQWQDKISDIKDRNDGTVISLTQKTLTSAGVFHLWGTKTIRLDASTVYGDIGFVLDITIRNYRIVSEHVIEMMSPEDAWAFAYQNVISNYHERTADEIETEE